MRKFFMMIGLAAGLAACMQIETAPVSTAPPPAVTAPAPAGAVVGTPQRNFAAVQARVMPVATRECRARAPQLSCDFTVVVDDRPGVPPNAYQTLDRANRPVIVFTRSLIEMTRNPDELAFVMGHEAAHHIENHIARQREAASAGALIFAGLASLTGGDATAVRAAQDIGAAVGARSYSKEFELEADRLGAIIAQRAGFDAINGTALFSRIPDPGNRFFGTHPPHAQRIAAVRQAVGRN